MMVSKQFFLVRFHHPSPSYIFCFTAIVSCLFDFNVILLSFSLSLGYGTGCVLSFEPSVSLKLLLLWLVNFMKVKMLSFLFSLIWYTSVSKFLDFEPLDWR